MSGNEHSPKGDTPPQLDGAEKPSIRRAYHTPTLRHLGSVRELTFGSGTMLTDGGGLPTGAMMLM